VLQWANPKVEQYHSTKFYQKNKPNALASGTKSQTIYWASPEASACGSGNYLNNFKWKSNR